MEDWNRTTGVEQLESTGVNWSRTVGIQKRIIEEIDRRGKKEREEKKMWPERDVYPAEGRNRFILE